MSGGNLENLKLCSAGSFGSNEVCRSSLVSWKISVLGTKRTEKTVHGIDAELSRFTAAAGPLGRCALVALCAGIRLLHVDLQGL